jgi:hypothetical protein
MLPPETIPGGNPVIALSGDTPTSPSTAVGPVLVTVEPAKTANVEAVPRFTGNRSAMDGAGAVIKTTSSSASSDPVGCIFLSVFNFLPHPLAVARSGTYLFVPEG